MTFDAYYKQVKSIFPNADRFPLESAYNAGFAAAREQAAEIAENNVKDWCAHSTSAVDRDDRIMSVAREDTSIEIAEAIRGMNT